MPRGLTKKGLPDNCLPGRLLLWPLPPCVLSLLGPWAAGRTLRRICLRFEWVAQSLLAVTLWVFVEKSLPLEGS